MSFFVSTDNSIFQNCKRRVWSFVIQPRICEYSTISGCSFLTSLRLHPIYSRRKLDRSKDGDCAIFLKFMTRVGHTLIRHGFRLLDTSSEDNCRRDIRTGMEHLSLDEVACSWCFRRILWKIFSFQSKHLVFLRIGKSAHKLFKSSRALREYSNRFWTPWKYMVSNCRREQYSRAALARQLSPTEAKEGILWRIFSA